LEQELKGKGQHEAKTQLIELTQAAVAANEVVSDAHGRMRRRNSQLDLEESTGVLFIGIAVPLKTEHVWFCWQGQQFYIRGD
jgi:hypothetical protein